MSGCCSQGGNCGGHGHAVKLFSLGMSASDAIPIGLVDR